MYVWACGCFVVTDTLQLCVVSLGALQGRGTAPHQHMCFRESWKTKRIAAIFSDVIAIFGYYLCSFESSQFLRLGA